MYMIFAGIAFSIFLLDVLMKHAIEERFRKNEERMLCNGKILIRRVHNKGVCLNLFQTYPDKVMWSSLVLGLCVLLYDIFLMLRKGYFLKKISMMFFTGGAFSNIYDRTVRGYVVDYIGFKTPFKKLTKITYNIGDFGIFAGAILFSIAEIFGHRH